jgi:signal transduction histidine kinase
LASEPSTWRYLAPIRSRSGALLGYLGVQLNVQPPGWRALVGDSFEAPALIVYALVFALGSALVLNLLVTRRLKRFELVAEAWGHGDFGARTSDGALDEIGRLGRRLDVMAADLKSLVALRARIASMNERERLAIELHDTVKQKAFALQLQLAALRLDPKLSGAVEECRRITAEIQAELAALIEPGAGRDAGADGRPFSEEIQDRADTWARRGGFDLATRLEAADGIPAAQRATVLRVLDEAMANIMRHSGAGSALVEVRRRGKSFELRVDDDGRGLGQAVDGVGVGAMRRRASELPQGRLLLTDASPGVRLSLKWTTPEEPAQ